MRINLTDSQLKAYAAQVKYAARLPARRRGEFAKSLHRSPSSLYRDTAKLRRGGVAALRRRGRGDRGWPRRVPFFLVELAVTKFFNHPKADFVRAYGFVVAACIKRGLKPPNYSTVLRWINSRFRRFLTGTGVVRLGDFKRVRKQA